MPDFSISKIILHRFYVDNYEGELGIGYGIIIGRDLMVKMGLSAYFKCKFIQWDGAAVLMKDPIGLIRRQYLTSREMR